MSVFQGSTFLDLDSLQIWATSCRCEGVPPYHSSLYHPMQGHSGIRTRILGSSIGLAMPFYHFIRNAHKLQITTLNIPNTKPEAKRPSNPETKYRLSLQNPAPLLPSRMTLVLGLSLLNPVSCDSSDPQDMMWIWSGDFERTGFWKKSLYEWIWKILWDGCDQVVPNYVIWILSSCWVVDVSQMNRWSERWFPVELHWVLSPWTHTHIHTCLHFVDIQSMGLWMFKL